MSNRFALMSDLAHFGLTAQQANAGHPGAYEAARRQYGQLMNRYGITAQDAFLYALAFSMGNDEGLAKCWEIMDRYDPAK